MNCAALRPGVVVCSGSALRLAPAPGRSRLPGLHAANRPCPAPLQHTGLQSAAAAGAAAAAAAGSTDPLKKHAGADCKMEQSRKDMRAVFDVDRWVLHRSTDRYFRHMAGLPNSRVLKGLGKPLGYVATISIMVCAYGEAVKANLLPLFFPALAANVKELFSMTSFALALLLVFRTNASYGRWDEGRKMWGLTLNRTRDLARLSLTWIGEEKKELSAMICRWAPAFMKSLMCHLRAGEDLRAELQGLLLPHEIEGVMRATHRPNYVLQVLSQCVRSAELPTAATLKMEEDLTSYEDCLGGCERLLRTPIPLFYTRHTSRFLVIWLTCLPFAIVPTCGWATVPLSLLISFMLLGIDKIGVSIEEPFSILALEVIANTALANVRELQAMHAGVGSAVAAAGNGGGKGNGAAAANGASGGEDVSAARMLELAGVAA